MLGLASPMLEKPAGELVLQPLSEENGEFQGVKMLTPSGAIQSCVILREEGVQLVSNEQRGSYGFFPTGEDLHNEL